MGHLSGIIRDIRQWIARDQKMIESQKKFGWRTFKMEGRQQVDLTDAQLSEAEARIAENKKRLEACEKRDA